MDAIPGRNGTSTGEDPYVGEYPGVCGGYPVIRNTRIPVRLVVMFSRDGATVDDMAEMWPHISLERIHGALAYYGKHPVRVDEDIERHERAYAEAHGLPWPAYASASSRTSTSTHSWLEHSAAAVTTWRAATKPAEQIRESRMSCSSRMRHSGVGLS